MFTGKIIKSVEPTKLSTKDKIVVQMDKNGHLPEKVALTGVLSMNGKTIPFDMTQFIKSVSIS